MHLSLLNKIFYAYVKIKDEKILITWEDGHVSPFEKSWLLSRSFKAWKQLEWT